MEEVESGGREKEEKEEQEEKERFQEEEPSTGTLAYQELRYYYCLHSVPSYSVFHQQKQFKYFPQM